MDRIPFGWIKDSVNFVMYGLFIIWLCSGIINNSLSSLSGDYFNMEMMLVTRIFLPAAMLAIIALNDFGRIRPHHRTFQLDVAHIMVLKDGIEHPLYKHLEEWFPELKRFSNKKYTTQDLTVKYTFPKDPIVDVQVISNWNANVCQVNLNSKAMRELSYTQVQRIKRFFLQYRPSGVPPVRTHQASTRRTKKGRKSPRPPGPSDQRPSSARKPAHRSSGSPRPQGPPRPPGSGE